MLSSSMMLRFSLLFLIMTTLLTGCSSDGKDPNDPTEPFDEVPNTFLPLKVGNWWEYSYNSSTASGSGSKKTANYLRLEALSSQSWQNNGKLFTLELTELDSSRVVIDRDTIFVATENGAYYKLANNAPSLIISDNHQSGERFSGALLIWGLQYTMNVNRGYQSGFGECTTIHSEFHLTNVDKSWDDFYQKRIGLVASEYEGMAQFPSPFGTIYAYAKTELRLIDYRVQ